MPRSEFRRFIGIDLGGGRGKNTAIARLERIPRERGDEADASAGTQRLAVAEAKVRHGHRGTGGTSEDQGDALFRDDVLVEYLDRWVDDETVVAINAPLTMPPCIRCQLPCPTVERCIVPVVMWMRRWAPRVLARGRSDRLKPAVTPYTQRAAEVLLAADGIRPRETLGQGTGPLAARASYLRRALSPRLRLHENLLEVHPRATLSRLFGAELERRSRHGEITEVWEARKTVLTGLRQGIAFEYVWPEVVVRNTHVFYAVMCAYTSFLWATQRWTGPTGPLPEGEAERIEGEPVDLAQRAADDLGDLWLEDGWIWVPPRSA
jgi:predicted nuclease with RNAse H fold